MDIVFSKKGVKCSVFKISAVQTHFYPANRKKINMPILNQMAGSNRKEI